MILAFVGIIPVLPAVSPLRHILASQYPIAPDVSRFARVTLDHCWGEPSFKVCTKHRKTGEQAQIVGEKIGCAQEFSNFSILLPPLSLCHHSLLLSSHRS
jgi:hypothetical protein